MLAPCQSQSQFPRRDHATLGSHGSSAGVALKSAGFSLNRCPINYRSWQQTGGTVNRFRPFHDLIVTLTLSTDRANRRRTSPGDAAAGSAIDPCEQTLRAANLPVVGVTAGGNARL